LKDKPVDGDEAVLMTEAAQLEAESKRTQQVASRKGGKTMSAIPLLQLVKQLLRNSGAQTMAQLSDIGSHNVSEDEPHRRISPHLHLLLRFQRLLFEQLFRHDREKSLDGDSENDLAGAKSLLRKYIGLLSSHFLEVLPVAASIAEEGPRHFAAVASVLENEVVGILLPEFVLCLTVFHLEDPQLFIR
jgi:E3 ubiquitin-protein ligase HERC2